MNKFEGPKKTLKDRAKEMTVRLPFMEGREKGNLDDLRQKPVTIREYGFLKGDSGEYAVFIVEEDPANFYFGGIVLTDALATFEAEGYHQAIVEEGLKIMMTLKKSKNNKPYTNVEFI